MSVVQYAFISLIGLGTSHFFSERYRKKNTNIRFILYVAAACAFGHQHYSILFEKTIVDNWLFFINSNSETVSGSLRFMSFVFLVSTTATLPPSKFSKLFNHFSRRY